VKQPMSKTSADAGKSSGSPLGSLLLLVLSYGMVISAPLLMRWMERMPDELAQIGGVPDWVPFLGMLGLALMGASAMVAVLMRVVNGMERHPYASLSTALAVLMGFMLLGLDTSVKLGAPDSTALAFLCLATSVIGGALSQRGGGLRAMFGTMLASLPGELVLIGVWTRAGSPRDPVPMLMALKSADRTFLALLVLSGVLLSIVAVMARSMAPRPRPTTTLAPRESRRLLTVKDLLALPPSDRTATGLSQTHPRERERLARAMALAVADSDKSDDRLTPSNYSVWNMHDEIKTQA
jgi:hypothetical protein